MSRVSTGVLLGLLSLLITGCGCSCPDPVEPPPPRTGGGDPRPPPVVIKFFNTSKKKAIVKKKQAAIFYLKDSQDPERDDAFGTGEPSLVTNGVSQPGTNSQVNTHKPVYVGAPGTPNVVVDGSYRTISISLTADFSGVLATAVCVIPSGHIAAGDITGKPLKVEIEDHSGPEGNVKMTISTHYKHGGSYQPPISGYVYLTAP